MFEKTLKFTMSPITQAWMLKLLLRCDARASDTAITADAFLYAARATLLSNALMADASLFSLLLCSVTTSLAL